MSDKIIRKCDLNSKIKSRMIISLWLACSEAATGTASATVCPCLWCGEPADRMVSGRDAGAGEAGHYVADSNGGEFDLANLHPTCRACNLDAGNENPADLWEPKYAMPTAIRMITDAERIAYTDADKIIFEEEANRRRARRTAK